jgi:hypothetical protein
VSTDHQNRRRRLTRVLAIVLSGLVLVGGPAHAQETDDTEPGPGLPPSSAGPEGSQDGEAGWAVQPAGPDGPGLRSAFTYNVQPGQTLRDSVSISNLSDEEITFAISSKDAFNTAADGAFALQDDDEEAVDVGSWVTIEVDEYTVPSGRRVDIPFELAVPDDAAPGDHAGGILAANVDVVDEVERDGVTLAVRQRVAARIYVRVAGPLEPALRIRNLQVSTSRPLIPWAQGRGTVTYTVENVGNTRIESATESQITGLFGRTVATPDSQDLPELLPGGSVEITEHWKGIPPVERLNADVEVVSLDGELSETASSSVFVWSWMALLVLFFVLATLLAWRIRKRRGKESKGEGTDAGPGDDGGSTGATAGAEPATVGTGGDA